MNKIPDRLKELRKANKLTQSNVAEKLQINRVTYTCWETGKHEPSIDQLAVLADFYKVSADYIIGRYN